MSQPIISDVVDHYHQKIEELERENAALREAGHLAEKIIVQRTDEIRHLERENAALKNAIALGQENCDAEYERLREERDEADKLKRELDGLRKDKERYEWLKSGVGSNWAYWHLHGNPCITDSFIDAAVTACAARAKEGGTT